MSDYQVIARKFRPQSFKEVVGQEAIVTTLKNAIKFNRLAQAYLFCGSRGTGKTTLARIFAKALNCLELSSDFEPCNQCSACKEITSGASLDILEIDGASHRGIEDIRQINENVGYASSSGRYKVYIIDEVHMLTKEAFNALLKTLEEPPPKVKFFFATTEPHKVLPTILSRCQRFNLNRIPLEKIVNKLTLITTQLGIDIEQEALRVLAQQAEGGLRDAESLLDQIIAFEEGKITVASVNSILGLMSKETYFELDQASKAGHLTRAFEIAHQVFSEGKDLMHFVEGLVEHYRTLLLVKLSTKHPSLLNLSSTEKEKYEASARLYSQEQCLSLIDYLIQAQNQLRFASSHRIALEAILLHVMRSHFRLPIEVLIRRLSELEQSIEDFDSVKTDSSKPFLAAESPSNKMTNVTVPPPSPSITKAELVQPKSAIPLSPSPPKQTVQPIFSAANVASSVSEDPTPTSMDLGKKETRKISTPAPSEPKTVATSSKTSANFDIKINNTHELKLEKPTHYYDTLLQFAAVELEGKVQKA